MSTKDLFFFTKQNGANNATFASHSISNTRDLIYISLTSDLSTFTCLGP